MALINFKDIDFNKSIDTTNKIINFNDSDIEIVNYLSARDKYDLIMITLQKSFEKNIYNPFKMDMYFDLNVVYSYTNMIFDDEDRQDEEMLYDTLTRSGFIALVKGNIDPTELAYLKDCISTLSETIIKYRNTFGSVVGALAEHFPDSMDKMQAMMASIDLEKMEGLLSLVKEINP